jgi:flavorubredoxin
MAKELFSNGKHRCIVFDDIMKNAGILGGDVQSNQFLITHTSASGDEEGLLFDPGGSKLITHLHQELMKYLPANRIKKLVLSHQDPDTGAGANVWLMLTGANARIYVSSLWVRFVPHFSRNDFKDDVFVPIQDQGMRLDHNGAEVYLLPAHFLHSAGNFHLYDPLSKILFSGDVGTSFSPDQGPISEVTDFEEHINYMAPFHRRYMASNRASRNWARMVRTLDIDIIVPQHGSRYFKGKLMVNKFIDWMDNLHCGADALAQDVYAVPKK